MFKRLRISTKILFAFVVIAVVAVGLIGYFAFTIGRNTLEQESFNKLTAVREMKASQIEDYFRLIENQVITFSEDRMIIEAMRAFDDSLHALETELSLTDTELERIDGLLERYYEEEFLPRLSQNQEGEVPLQEFWPADDKVRMLQHLYLSDNPFEVGSKHLLEDAEDGSSYSQAHQVYHPIIRDFLEKFGYYDIFLVDVDEGGHIAYSVFKEVDFGTSLIDGPYASSGIGRAYRAARYAIDRDDVFLVDYDPYAPSYNAPAAFISSPIFDGDEKIGALIFQMPIDRIDAIMTNNRDWSAVGLGESGETYLVGDDFTLRNQSRFLIENSDSYFALIEEIGVPATAIDRIRNLNTTIGLQEVVTEGTQAALNGEIGTAIFPDYRGVPVLSSYKSLDIAGLNWVIMSEIDEAEAFASIRTLGTNLALGSTALVVFIVLAAALFSRTLTRPLAQLTDDAEQLSYGNLDLEIGHMDSKDEIGDLARNFDVMRLSLKRMIDDMAQFNKNLEALVKERTAELEASERQSNSIIAQSGDAIIVIDEAGDVLVWNAKAEQLFGYSREEMIGNPMDLIIPGRHRTGHAEAFARATDTHRLNKPDEIHELSGRHKDGNEFPVELSLSQWQLGGKSYFSGSIRDITERKQAERAIQDREERIRSIVEIAPDAIISIDGEQNIVMFNAQAEQIFGYSAGEVLGHPLTMLMPGSSHAIHPREVLKFLNEPANARFMDERREIKGRRKDGTIFPAEAGISKLKLDGQPLYTTFFRDVTARREAERRLKESEAKHRTIFQNSPLGMILFDKSGRTLKDASDPEVREGLTKALGGEPHTYEGNYTSTTGGVTRFLRIIYNPVNLNQSPTEVIATLEDITERKKIEAALQQSEERLAFALEGSNDGLWDWNPQTNALYFSPRWQTMIGYEPGELEPEIGTWEKLVHPEDLDRVNAMMSEHLEGRSPSYEAEYRLQTKSGDWVWILARGKVASYDADGKPIRFVGTHVDVSERKRLEANIANQLSFIQSLVETIPNPLFVKGIDTRFINFNSAYEKAFGIDANEYIGKTILDMGFLPEATRQSYQDEDSALLQSGGEFSREIQVSFSDQQIHDVIYQVSTFDLPDGERGGLVGLMTDISQIKELERQLAIANERMSTELNFARDIQLDMLPLIFPAFPNRTEVAVHAALESAREVGGDFYDFYFLDDDHLCFVIGDVAGKGAPGALMMAVSKTLIKSRASDDDEPASILTHVNDELSQDNKSSMFVTVFLGVINVKSGEIVYTNAGHNPPFIRRHDGTLEKVDAFHGPVIGAMPGLPYQQDSDTLHPGDIILLYTDGVTEAFSEDEQLFSEERLESLLQSESLDSAESIVTGTIEEVARFSGEAEQSDDITLLAVQYLGLTEAMESHELTITIVNRFEEMGIVEEQFSEFAKAYDLPDGVRQSMSTVIDEMLNMSCRESAWS
jgi:PAS domain S-box-containing protein